MLALLKRPSAFLPPVISAGFLTFFAIGSFSGTLVRRPDEGSLIVVFFAVSWLPKEKKPALQLLTLQCGAAVAVLAVVYFRHL